MAIGSGAEIGIVFGRWGDMTQAEKDHWCATFRDRFGDDLLKGYATINYPARRKVNGNTQEETHMCNPAETDSEGSPPPR
jgi:hypothetical protein